MTNFQRTIVTILSIFLGLILLFVGYHFLYTIPQQNEYKQTIALRDLKIKEDKERLDREKIEKETQDKNEAQKIEDEQDKIFEKNQECQKYKNEFKTKSENALDSIKTFYSPSLKTCIVTNDIILLNVYTNKPSAQAGYISNALTSESYYSYFQNVGEEMTVNKNTYPGLSKEQIIEKLKQ